MSQPVITVENLSKRYLIGHQRARSDGFRHVIESALRAPFKWFRTRHEEKRRQKEEFWALKDVSFDVKEGEVVGLIGRNGAGKSTLLKVLSRITEPTTGKIHLRGRVASLLEVGTGFHPELTGRENIFLNGAILGMGNGEIKKKFDEIVAFSEIEKFLDTPVKRYSSGMYVRLAFSVAAHLDPDILIVDEVLAVGDAAFQKKCLGKMEEARRRSRTVLFVSHNIAAVESLCSRVVVLDQGHVTLDGPCKEVIQHYLLTVRGHQDAAYSDVIDLGTAPGRPRQYRPQLKRIELLDKNNRPLGGKLLAGGALKALIHVELETPCADVDAELSFHTLAGERVCTANSAYEPGRVRRELSGLQVFSCEIPSFPLVPGEYRISVSLERSYREVDHVEGIARLTVVRSDYYGTGVLPVQGVFLLNNHWTVQSPVPAPDQDSTSSLVVPNP
jgi:lipopolysaccharide transport system ATP-binding protein